MAVLRRPAHARKRAGGVDAFGRVGIAAAHLLRRAFPAAVRAGDECLRLLAQSGLTRQTVLGAGRLASTVLAHA
jgi:hypothetical protein